MAVAVVVVVVVVVAFDGAEEQREVVDQIRAFATQSVSVVWTTPCRARSRSRSRSPSVPWLGVGVGWQ